MSHRLRDDCFRHGGKRLRHAEALALLRERLTPSAGTEVVALSDAPGRVLAETVTAPRNIPAHDYSAMDGYAFAHAAYDADSGTWFALAGRAAAGHAFAGTAGPGEAVRILTGAMMPGSLDTVAMQEDVRLEERGGVNGVFIPGGLKLGANRRLAGEDMRAGAAVAAAGLRLRPQDIAVLAATGSASVRCYRRLRVALVSTGDEIVRPGAPLAAGQIYDANGPMLAALIRLSGAEVTDLGVLPDKADTVRACLTDASARFDAIITSGGASHGDEDHMATAAASLGALHVWEIAIKPGKPVSFGQIGDCVFLGLPGNPVAAFVCFLLYGAPVLSVLGGGAWREPRRYFLPAAFSIQSRKTGRREFLRGMPGTDDAGNLVVNRYPHDGSGLISSLQASEGLIEIPEDITTISVGDHISFIPYSEFGILS